MQRDVGERIHRRTSQRADKGIHKDTGDRHRTGQVTGVAQVSPTHVLDEQSVQHDVGEAVVLQRGQQRGLLEHEDRHHLGRCGGGERGALRAGRAPGGVPAPCPPRAAQVGPGRGSPSRNSEGP